MPKMLHHVLTATAFVVVTATAAIPAFAQTGVSDDRVSLPDGPGSLDGVGDNVSVSGNMGLMSNSVPISVPAGVNGMTPSLGLSYSSGGGNGPFGMGWSMGVPSIERMTSKGLPEYVSDDRFVADGGNELVRVGDAEPATYRARYEGNFIRYQWHSRGSGDEGYWTADYPGGNTAYFGADRDGNLVETARVRAPDGVFRYMIVDSLDAYGNHVNYDYRYYGSVPLVDTVSWVFTPGSDTPRFTAQYEYETREDPISDARGGFNERTAHRATDIRISSAGTLIRRYSLGYEDYATSGGVSRLVSVERYGRDGGLYGVRNTFEYSRALSGVCDAEDCEAPLLVTAGSIGAGFGTGRVNLIDLNGDSLPDAIHTPASGAHQVFLAEMDGTTGAVGFAAPFDSAVGDSGSYEMSSPYTQVLDVDGDGFTDLLDSLSGRYLINKGTGDWEGEGTLAGGENLPDFAEDFSLDGENELTHIRFTDIDGDRRIDVLRSDSIGTSLFRNVGGGGFASAPVDEIEAAFSEDATDLGDVNGDGLLDPIQLRDGVMRYRLSLGRGKWAAWAEMTGMPFDLNEIPFVEVEDINGDGMDDVLLVQGSSVRFALNRNNAAFTPEVTVNSASGQGLPNVDDTVTVLYADMNGNGSNDIIWVDDNGNVTFLDVFPTRPHLLARIENGVGYTADITYGSLARERARDGGEGWDDPVPSASLVVNTVDVYAMADDPALVEHEFVTYTYTGGYYDGDEKQFRGFRETRESIASDDGNFEAVTTFDVGAGVDRGHFAGIELHQDLLVDGTSIQEFTTTYENCPVADVPTTTPPIQFACEVSSEAIEKEQAPEAEWVTTRDEQTYDGYGNVVRSVDHGVVAVGGQGCAACDRAATDTGVPCGAQCIGDESYDEADFLPVANVSDNYVTGLVQERRTYALEGGPVKRSRFFFDGPAFEGLPAGQATVGALTRVSREETEGVFIDTERHRLNAFGHAVESLRAGGDVDSAHRTLFTYSADGRDILRTEEFIQSRDERLTLALDVTYESDFGRAASASGWYIVGVDDPTAKQRFWTYDEHGRIASLVEPGNSLTSPSEVYTYELTSPFSKIITEKRSTVGGPLDLRTVNCVDGLGRTIQTRGRVNDTEYLVSGYTVYDRAGNTTRLYDPYTADNDDCARPPDTVKFTEMTYDGLGRVVQTSHPDGDERGTPSIRRTEYLPMAVRSYNEDDNDPDAVGFDTPTTMRRDGRGRTVSVERPAEDGSLDVYSILYDGLGRLKGYLAPGGTTKTQAYNLMDRVVSVDDPDAGEWIFEYSEAGDLVRSVDGRGIAIERAYDSVGRKIEEWNAADPDESLAEFFYDQHPECPTDACTFGAGVSVGSRSRTPEGVVVDAYGFNENGESIHSARLFRGNVTRVDRTLDNASRVTQEAFTGGITLNYGVDPISRPTSIEGLIESVRYRGDGQIEGWTAANGIDTAFAFNARQHVVGITAQRNGTDVLAMNLTRDRNANVIAVDETAAPAAVNVTGAFTLNALTQLISAEFGDETITFATDSLFRTTEKVSSLGASSPAHAGTLAYDGAHPRGVTDAGGVAFEYDVGGFVTSRDDDTFDWDHLGRLRNITRSGTSLIEIARDGVGGRVLAKLGNEERQYLGRRMEVRDGIVRVRVRIGDDVVAVVESSSSAADVLGVSGTDGEVTGADAFAASASEQGTLLRSAARRMLLDVGGTDTFVHQDHLGSTLAVTDEAGEVRERFAYYPYGAVRATTAIQTEWASYTNVEDDGTGYLDYRNRVLSTREGRWLSPDPLYTTFETAALESPEEAFAAYSFVGNNPMTTVDIDGFVKWAKVAKIAAVTVSTIAAVAAVVAISIAGAGVVNAVGAVIGGVVSGVAEAATIRAKLKSQNKSFRSLPLKTKLKLAGSVLFKTSVGAASGFATGGLSAVGTVISGAADVVETNNPNNRAVRIGANVARVVAVGVNIGLGAADPLGAAAGGGAAAIIGGGSETASSVAEAGSTAVEVVAELAELAADAGGDDGGSSSSSAKKTSKKAKGKKSSTASKKKRSKTRRQKVMRKSKKTSKKAAKPVKKAAKPAAKKG